ncbi:MAG: DUF4157 domain-containing protein [Deltaproteobacteria bacterium]|nr:DUF4157 domain-containing protein [Deltaproteobacteria bacterium]
MPVQARAGGPLVREPGLVHTHAAAGVQGAGERMPHAETIAESFGEHGPEVDQIQAHIGGSAASAAAAIGAEAYATGNAVAFQSAPDLFTAAHEAAHVVQQRAGVQLLGGVGDVGDAYEQHADRVANAVVAGQSAAPLLDELPARGAMRSSVQRSPAPAAAQAAAQNPIDLYLKVNENHVWPAVRDQLASVPWPTPDPHIAWRSQRVFAQRLTESLARTVHFDVPAQLREVVFPANPAFTLEPLYPGTNMLWVPAIGTALGQLLQDAILPSLARLGPRWAAAAEHEPNLAAETDAGLPLVHYEQIPTSAPIDRAVAFALCAAGAIAVARDAGTAPTPHKPKPLRAVTKLEWQGERDPSLWNWVKAVEPADATAEEVAASLFKRHDNLYGGEPTSFLAYSLTAAPPMFGVPPSWARSMSGAKEHAPAAGTTDESRPGRWAALGSDTATDGIALAEQRGHDAKGDAPELAALLKGLSDSALVARTMMAHLQPWKLAAPVAVAYGWLLGKEAQLSTMSPQELGPWAPIITDQQDRLGRISIGLNDVLRAAPRMGIAGPDSPGASQVTDVLESYASAAAVSHLRDQSEALIDQAAAQQAMIGARALRATVNDMDMVVGQTSGLLSRDDRQQAADLTAKGNELQVKLARGETVDATALDETSLASEELAFKGRISGLLAQTTQLEAAAHAAGDGLASHIASHFHGSFRRLEQAITPLRRTLGSIEAYRLDASSDASLGADSHPGVDDVTERRTLRRMGLNKAKAELAELRSNSDLTYFLREGGSIVQWQGFATACVNTLALIGVSFVSAGVGSVVGEAAEGVFAAGMGAESVAELSAGARLVAGGIRYGAGAAAESAGNAAGQVAIQGGEASLSGAFLENLIQKVGSDVVLGQLAKDLGAAKDLEKRAGGMWVKRAGRFVLKESAVVTAHTLWGAAIGNVAHMLVERKAHAASPMELRDWFLQGAATALGRYAHQFGKEKAPLANKLGTLGLPTGNRAALTTTELLMLAERAQSHPTGDDAVAIVRTRNELLDQLDQAIGELEARPDIAAHADVGNTASLREQIGDDRRALASGPTEDLAIQDSGLRNVANSGVYEGSPEQIEHAIANAKRMGLEGKRGGKNPATGNQVITIGDRSFEVHETSSGGEHKASPSEDAIRWHNEVREKLTPEERARLERMIGKRSLEEVKKGYKSTDDAAETVRRAYRTDLEAGAKVAASQARQGEIRQFAEDRGLLKSDRVEKILADMANAENPKEAAREAAYRIRSLVMSEFMASKILAEHPGAGHGVLADVVVWQETTQATPEELKRERPELFASGRPGTRFIETARGRKLYVQVTDMDLVVVQDQVSGRRRVVHREELKTGANDSPKEARAQLNNGADAVASATTGGPPVALFLGDTDITATIDLPSVGSSTSATRGPAGKGFETDLGINSKDLDALAQQLLKLAQATTVPEEPQ